MSMGVPLNLLLLSGLVSGQPSLSASGHVKDALHYTLQIGKEDEKVPLETINVFSKLPESPSFTIQYSKEGKPKILTWVESENHSYFYEDSDGDGIFDKGVHFDKKTNVSRKFSIETKIIYE